MNSVKSQIKKALNPVKIKIQQYVLCPQMKIYREVIFRQIKSSIRYRISNQISGQLLYVHQFVNLIIRRDEL